MRPVRRPLSWHDSTLNRKNTVFSGPLLRMFGIASQASTGFRSGVRRTAPDRACGPETGAASLINTAEKIENPALLFGSFRTEKNPLIFCKPSKYVQNDSQHSVNPQSTLQSTLPKCWKIQNFAVLDIENLKTFENE